MDNQLLLAFETKNPEAITLCRRHYGSYCMTIAQNILSSREDAEECVSDTWLHVWEHIPPDKPQSFKAYLGRIVRNLCLDRYRANHTQKRDCELQLLLSELEDCIPSTQTVEETVERKRLGESISRFLDSLPLEDRRQFVRRYWYGDSVKRLAQENHTSPNQMSQKLLRLRRRLRDHLEQEDFSI